jgi:hypothetical protein
MTKRLSIAERQSRALARSALKSQRDLFSDAVRSTDQVPNGSHVLRSTAPDADTFVWGPLSGTMYERAKDPSENIDESSVPGVPYVMPHFSLWEYGAYRDWNEHTKSLFLLLVAFSLKSDGL